MTHPTLSHVNSDLQRIPLQAIFTTIERILRELQKRPHIAQGYCDATRMGNAIWYVLTSDMSMELSTPISTHPHTRMYVPHGGPRHNSSSSGADLIRGT